MCWNCTESNVFGAFLPSLLDEYADFIQLSAKIRVFCRQIMPQKSKKLGFFSNLGKNSNFFIAGDGYSRQIMGKNRKKSELYASKISCVQGRFNCGSPSRNLDISFRQRRQKLQLFHSFEFILLINFGRRSLLNKYAAGVQIFFGFSTRLQFPQPKARSPPLSVQ